MARRKNSKYNTPGSKRIAKYARYMRKGAATIHEQIVRDLLRNICNVRKLTLKNQKIFYNEKKEKWYIADFFVVEIKLVIEIDGKNHKKTVAYDQKRTEFLMSLGNSVIRFSNDEIDSENMSTKLQDVIEKRISEVRWVAPRTKTPEEIKLAKERKAKRKARMKKKRQKKIDEHVVLKGKPKFVPVVILRKKEV
jgi:very-short-patch-repair endonuclease